MRTFCQFMLLLLLLVGQTLLVPVFGQNPPPCGEKGIPDNVPCVDVKTGKVLHTKNPSFIPHQDRSSLPRPDDRPLIPADGTSSGERPNNKKPPALKPTEQSDTTAPVFSQPVPSSDPTPERTPSPDARPGETTDCSGALNCFAQGYERAQARQAEGQRLDAAQERRTKALAAQARREQTAAAQQAYTLMEQLRESISGLSASNASEQKAIDDVTSSWWAMRKMYCAETQSGHYIDIEGKEASCMTN